MMSKTELAEAVAHALSGQVAFQGRDIPASIEHSRRAIALDPTLWIGYIQLAQALGFTLDALRANIVTRAGQTRDEIHEDMLRRLDTRLVEIDQMLATLRAQRKDLLAVRAQMEASWAEGQCLDAGSVTLTPVGHPSPAPALPRARRAARVDASAPAPARRAQRR